MSPSHHSSKTSSCEFSNAPRNSYAQPLPVRFYLNHFRSSTTDYVLDETGWESITQFEDKARQYDMFTTYISPNGFLTAHPPQVDTECFRVFEFSLHHLKRDVLDRLMYYYIGMNLTDYELQYPEYNTLYLAIPYYSWLCATETNSCHKQTQGCCVSSCQQQSECWAGLDQYDETSDTETDVSVECSKPVSSKLLSNWHFKINRETKNSYILQPPSQVTKVSGGYAYWGKDQRTHTTWKLQMKGLERPLYYNSKYEGWIVSLKLGDTLIENGAAFRM